LAGFREPDRCSFDGLLTGVSSSAARATAIRSSVRTDAVISDHVIGEGADANCARYLLTAVRSARVIFDRALG
jgi:hypothetical protein